MSYRDDLESAQSRAAALEREVEELREQKTEAEAENEQLRTANAALIRAEKRTRRKASSRELEVAKKPSGESAWKRHNKWSAVPVVVGLVLLLLDDALWWLGIGLGGFGALWLGLTTDSSTD